MNSSHPERWRKSSRNNGTEDRESADDRGPPPPPDQTRPPASPEKLHCVSAAAKAGSMRTFHANPHGRAVQAILGKMLVEGNNAAVHVDDPRDQCGDFVHPVARHDHGAIAPLGEEPEKLLPRHGIKIGGRLVEDEQAGARPSAMAISSFCFLPPRSLTKGLAAISERSSPSSGGQRRSRARSPVALTPQAKPTRSDTVIFEGGGNCGTKPISAQNVRAACARIEPENANLAGGNRRARSGSGWSCPRHWRR